MYPLHLITPTVNKILKRDATFIANAPFPIRQFFEVALQGFNEPFRQYGANFVEIFKKIKNILSKSINAVFGSQVKK